MASSNSSHSELTSSALRRRFKKSEKADVLCATDVAAKGSFLHYRPGHLLVVFSERCALTCASLRPQASISLMSNTCADALRGE